MGTAVPGEGGRGVNDISRNRVMLVDDHPMWIEALGEDLTEEGFEIVAVAKNGTECLQRARATRPDVVVMDLQIPAPDGATCTELLVQEFPDIQVLVMSASGEHRVPRCGATNSLDQLGLGGRFHQVPPAWPDWCWESSGAWSTSPTATMMTARC